MTDIYIATEDTLSEAVAEKLVLKANLGLRVVARIGNKGNDFLKNKAINLAKTAQCIPVFMLTDLDRVTCPQTLITNWLGRQPLPQGFLFRVVVREIEAWLLADRCAFSRFSGVPVIKVPQNPESLADPKQELINLIRRYGRSAIKSEILPEADSTANVGTGYNQTLSAFVRDSWSPVEAVPHADSLARACRRLSEITRL
ncbi:MAG: hypothetical protein M0Z78_06575 [Betaproteobacteria bacterium]|jgi:hypothetical protein|nr:hypothetical protein [Betaproteobacteria bacterium]